VLKKRATFDPSIFQTRPGGGAEWSTFLALAFFHNLENGAWPSMRTISDITGMDKGTVSRAIKSLEEKDLVRIEYRRGRRLYRLPIDHHNRLLGGPDRWNYQDQRVADSQQEVVISQQRVADSQRQGCEMTTPSETRPPVSNVHIGTSHMNRENPSGVAREERDPRKPAGTHEEYMERLRQEEARR
jgi:DNA-binding transcriptional ArsR family regulator